MAPLFCRLIPALLLVVLTACQKTPTTQAQGPAGPPPVPISAAQSAQESVPTELRVVGTVEASAIVQVRSQVAGPLVRVAFAEGQNVKQGDLLFEIDPRPYEEAVRQADAAVQRDRAQINQMQATLARDSAQARFNDSDAARYRGTGARRGWYRDRRPTRRRPARMWRANRRARRKPRSAARAPRWRATWRRWPPPNST